MALAVVLPTEAVDREQTGWAGWRQSADGPGRRLAPIAIGRHLSIENCSVPARGLTLPGPASRPRGEAGPYAPAGAA